MDNPPLFAGEITILVREMPVGAPDNSPNLGKPGRSEALQKFTWHKMVDFVRNHVI